MLTRPIARSAVTDKRRSVIIFKGKRAPGTGGAETGKGRVAPKAGRGAAHAFTLVLLMRAKTHEASPDRSGTRNRCRELRLRQATPACYAALPPLWSAAPH